MSGVLSEYSNIVADIFMAHRIESTSGIFLDILAGPASLTMSVLEKRKSAGLLSPESQRVKYIITDSSSIMLSEARMKVASFCATNHSLALDIIMKKVDPCDKISVVQPGSVHQLGCLFGIMSFTNRPAALRNMHGVLAEDGIAVFGSWAHHDFKELARTFASYCDVLDPAGSENMDRLYNIGATEASLVTELASAGFSGIHITPHERGFLLENSPSLFPSVLLQEPLTGACFNKELCASVNLSGKWLSFSGLPEFVGWFSEDHLFVNIRTIALIAIAQK